MYTLCEENLKFVEALAKMGTNLSYKSRHFVIVLDEDEHLLPYQQSMLLLLWNRCGPAYEIGIFYLHRICTYSLTKGAYRSPKHSPLLKHRQSAFVFCAHSISTLRLNTWSDYSLLLKHRHVVLRRPLSPNIHLETKTKDLMWMCGARSPWRAMMLNFPKHLSNT